jgi:nicotinamide mononucleotide transporter
MRRSELAIGIILSAALIFASWQMWLPYSLTETLGFVTGAACVYLVVRQNIWNFPVGIANNIFFIILFLDARLYGDAGLQVVYIALAMHGWYWWLRGGKNHSPRKVSHASTRQLLIIAALVALGTVALTLALQSIKGSAPVLDAFTTVLSLAAQVMLNWKFIENWYAWIAADVVYIYLYLSRDLQLTAALYFLFLCLCIAGLLSWRRSLAADGLAGVGAQRLGAGGEAAGD